jgi:O-antigen ligase
VVTPVQAGRAHSDWLEWTLEAGLPGLLVLATFLGLVGLLAWRALRPARNATPGPAGAARRN